MRKLMKSKKGFTLIEMIVAMVRLAIMAAIAVPSMIGFINQANERAQLTEARVGLVAAQVLVTENSGTLPTGIFTAGNASNTRFLALVTGVSNPTGYSNVQMTGAEVVGITYTNGRNPAVTINVR